MRRKCLRAARWAAAGLPAARDAGPCRLQTCGWPGRGGGPIPTQPGPACGPLVSQGIVTATVIGPFHPLLKSSCWLRAGTVSDDHTVPPPNHATSQLENLSGWRLGPSPPPLVPLCSAVAPMLLAGSEFLGEAGLESLVTESGENAPTSAAVGVSTTDSDQQRWPAAGRGRVWVGLPKPARGGGHRRPVPHRLALLLLSLRRAGGQPAAPAGLCSPPPHEEDLPSWRPQPQTPV